jgi:hypothetical protein
MFFLFRLSAQKLALKQRLDEVNRDLQKSNFPTKHVAEMGEIGMVQMAELTRLLALAKKTIRGVSCDDPELLKVVSLLSKLEAGVAVTTAGFQHELDAAKVVDENGMAILIAIEGKTSMTNKFSIRRDFMVKEITKVKVDAATLAAANRGGGGGGGRGRGGGGGG